MPFKALDELDFRSVRRRFTQLGIGAIGFGAMAIPGYIAPTNRVQQEYGPGVARVLYLVLALGFVAGWVALCRDSHPLDLAASSVRCAAALVAIYPYASNRYGAPIILYSFIVMTTVNDFWEEVEDRRARRLERAEWNVGEVEHGDS